MPVVLSVPMCMGHFDSCSRHSYTHIRWYESVDLLWKWSTYNENTHHCIRVRDASNGMLSLLCLYNLLLQTFKLLLCMRHSCTGELKVNFPWTLLYLQVEKIYWTRLNIVSESQQANRSRNKSIKFAVQ